MMHLIDTITNHVGIILISLIILLITLAFWLIYLQLKINKLLLGTGSKNIGDSLVHIDNNLKDVAKFRIELEEYLRTVEKRVRKSTQGIHTVRFNPFKGTGDGSNQSFATALINQEGNGVVFSSIYSRDRVSVFSKPLIAHKSEFELSKEELDAISEAVKKLQ
ncbi:MAG: DUF4446 family protein [Patescibacteria group bacterium]|nr:DUF4446 family protein [Patescibacteria group bacterium]